MLLQTQDAGGPRGRFNFNAYGTGQPGETGDAQRRRQLRWRRSCSTGRDVVQRDLKVIDQPGTRHWAVASFIQDKWQVRSNVTVDLGLRWEYYTPLEGLSRAREPGQLRPGDQHAFAWRATATPTNALNVKKNFKNFAPRTGVSWRLNDKTVVRAGYGASTIPFPDNRFAFNFPVKQNYSGTAANGFQRRDRWRPAFPRPSLANIPADGDHPATGALQNSTFDVIPTDLREGTLHSWNVAFQRQLPFGFTADIAYVGNRGVDLVMDVDTNASLIYGSGNNGRPQFAQFNRTGTNRTRTNDNKSQYNGAPGEGGPPVPERPPGHQLLHARAGRWTTRTRTPASAHRSTSS